MIGLKGKYLISLFIILAATGIFMAPVSAKENVKKANNTINDSEKVCGVYFTGVGCPHCAVSDPIVLKDYPRKYPSFVVIEYEIYHTSGNGKVMNKYSSNIGIANGIPQMIIEDEFEAGESISREGPTTTWTEKKIKNLESAKCTLYDGSKISFENLSLNSLPGKPKIWNGEKILINTGEKQGKFKTIEPQPAEISQGKVEFKNAVRFGEWIFQWNGKSVEDFEYTYNPTISENKTLYVESDNFLKKIISSENISETLKEGSKRYDEILESNISSNDTFNGDINDLTPAKAIELAFADAVNPCAIAVMIIMLTAIVNYNPDDKRKILLAGFAFVASIFVTYLFYGIVIVNFMKWVQSFFTSAKTFVYLVVGVLASILGILNISDYINYKPGGFLTEMPMFLRPKMKKVLDKVTSPRGAAVVGIFVTLFLLPCTIGPYFAFSAGISFFGLIEILPWLLFYNLIFVSPMVGITLIIYKGTAEAEDVSKWRDENIKYLHLGAGIIIFGIGAAMALAGGVPILQNYGINLYFPIDPLGWSFMVWPLILGVIAPYLANRFERKDN